MPGKQTTTKSKSRTFGTQTSGREKESLEGKEKGIQVGTYPDITEKAALTMEKGRRECFPKINKAGKEVYLFMRGKKELIQRLKNAFIRDKRVVENYGGRYIGLAENLKRCEGELYRGLPEQCLVIIEFKDMAHAERWTQSSGSFKQRDFPSPSDEMEMFATPVSYLPSEGLSAFQLTEMYGLQCSPSEFNEKYVSPVTQCLNKRRIYHGVVATNHVNRLRNCMIRPDTYVLLYCAEDECKLTDFYDSAEYRKYKDFRQMAVAETNTCFFKLQPVTNS
ncbi:hypothetical protein ACF0H5_006716 [Mactra antiquata]